jgi:hypothetical protein
MATFFHIGLPKTATTFWQYSVFKRIEDMTVIRRSTGTRVEAFLKDTVQYLHRAAGEEAPELKDLHAFLRRKSGRQDLLVSNENISMTNAGFWQGHGASPEDVADFLQKAGAALPGQRIGVIVGLRDPDSWLASRYAESSKGFTDFGQADFERRMTRLAQTRNLDGVEKWLDQAYLRDLFSDRFGAGNVYFPAMERLETDAEAAILEMGRFLKGRDFGYIVAALKAEGQLTAKRNSLSDESGSWRLRSDGSPLTFPPDLRAALVQRFGQSSPV